MIINVALGGHYYSNHMFDEAIEQLRKTLEMDPNFVHAHAYLGLVYIKKGLIEEGIAECQKAVELSGGRISNYTSQLDYAYAVSARRSEAPKNPQ